MSDKSLLNQIQSLTRPQVLEAANSFANLITAELVDQETESIADMIKDNPARHLDEVEELSRILLINASEDDEYKELVKEVVDNVGKKQAVLGGTEIIALALIGVAALRIIKNPKKKEEITVKKPDGSLVEIKKEYDNDTSFLGAVFAKLFK